MKLNSFLIGLSVLVIILLGYCSPGRMIKVSTKHYIKEAPYDVIIVPGYPFASDSKDSVLVNARMNWAKTLYDRKVARNLIFSGAAVHTPYVEGAVMKILADSMGIPAEHTFIEDCALHSNENAKYGKQLAKKLGFKKIAVATDPYQFAYMRYLMFISAPGVPIITFPMDSMKYYIDPLPQIDAREAMVKNFIPLEQRN